LEKHDDTRQQLHLQAEQMRQKNTQHSVNNETLAMRISDCMQRLLATEEGKANVENQNALLQHALAKAKQMMLEKDEEMLEKDEEAAQVLQSLKAINQQLIQAKHSQKAQQQKTAAHRSENCQKSLQKEKNYAVFYFAGKRCFFIYS
jgi:hypothetical protein